MRKIVEMRILPPFAIARLGSSIDPMDNYDLVITDPIGTRQIQAARTLLVDPQTGQMSVKHPPFTVSFRDSQGNIRPIAPFLELWVQFDTAAEFVPLTIDILAEFGLTPDAVQWSAHVANIKAYRRTGDPNDRVEARIGPFSDHAPHTLNGECNNFFAGKSLPLGTVQYPAPSAQFPDIRLRFTPAAGKVYGPPPDPPHTTDPNIADAVYDPAKGGWKGYFDPTDVQANPLGVRRATNPAQIYAGKAVGDNQISYGYLDDECDGFVEASLTIEGTTLQAYGRVVAGPPTFAPDSLPVRTMADELEQAMFGPDLETPLTAVELAEVRDLVRRALETVRLMNTGQMNKPSSQRGVGMARMDYLDVNRALAPIVDPAVADSLAIRSRHERVLLALESGSLAWFARVLRNYDEVGDLSEDARRKMPALMRGADGRHMALTRRQVSKVQAAAQYFINLSKGDQA
jgi:hypothetical protein